jgi:uncharacterized protein (DUF1810 family)
MNYNLDRFKIAQQDSHVRALHEMKNGEKKGHWMWFTFPQIAGLGKSQTSKMYELVNLEEASEYLKDEVLSSRLIELTDTIVFKVHGKTPEAIFGFTDSRKLHSSMTLFHAVVASYTHFENDNRYRCFENALIKLFQNKLDQRTLSILGMPNLRAPEIATRDSWQITPIINPQPIQLNLRFSDRHFFELKKGFIPRDMDDRWFIYYENEWLYFHRSWTGLGFYKVKLNKTDEGYSIDELWTERNNIEITHEKDLYDIETFSALIDMLFRMRIPKHHKTL